MMKGNQVMVWLICSPLHGLVSKNMMVMTYAGRKSGTQYQTPVNYVLDGNVVWTTSMRDRIWWRNFRDGQTVMLRLRGQDVQATPTVYETDQAVAEKLIHFFQLNPRVAEYFDVRLNSEGLPEAEDVARAAPERVMVQFNLT